MAYPTILGSIAYPAIDPVAFSVGPLSVHWYGLAYLAGFVSAAALLRVFAKRWGLGLSDDDVLSVVLAAVIGVIVGGRLGYVLFYGGSFYWEDPVRILRMWDGGMSFHGGLVGILAAGAVVARQLRMPALTLWDLGAIGAPIGFGLGRVANFINGELWGRVSDVPWAMVFPGAGSAPRHPSQLYEAILEGAVLLVVMILLARRMPPRPRGELVGWLLATYACMRIAVEFVREPDAQLSFIAGGWVTMGMVLSVPMLAAGIACVWWARRQGRSQLGPDLRTASRR